MRKPIQHEMIGMRTPRERVWAAVRKLKASPFTIELVQDSTLPLVSIDAVQDYLLELCQSGYLHKLGDQGRTHGNKFGEVNFKLVKDSFEAPCVTLSGRKVTQGTGTLAMWRAMIALKEFDWHDIQRAASLPGAAVSSEAAKTYVNRLNRAGYFRPVRASKPGTTARFRLVKNTGSYAPAITRRKAVFDRNTGKFSMQGTKSETVDVLE